MNNELQFITKLHLQNFATKASCLHPTEYCRWGLSILEERIGVSGALWGLREQSGYVDILAHSGFEKEDFSSRYASVAHLDPVTDKLQQHPGKAIEFDAKSACEGLDDYISGWAEDFSVGKSLSIGYFDPGLNLTRCLVLFRPPEAENFQDNDKKVLEAYAKLLFDGLKQCCKRELSNKLLNNWFVKNAVCVVTKSSVVLEMDPEFEEKLQEIWHSWKGPQLPEELRVWLMNRELNGQLRKKNFLFRVLPFDDYKMLILTKLGRLGNLTDKQFEIAKMYSGGMTTKQIASEQNKVVYTIENHRKQIYERLDIRSNFELIEHFEAIRQTPAYIHVN